MRLSLLPTKKLKKMQCHGNGYFNALFKRIKVKYRTLNRFPLFSSARGMLVFWRLGNSTSHNTSN